MLYNVTTMATTWHTVATRDVRLLKLQMDIVSRLPKEYVFLNYLRCHDDIGWGLDYGWLRQFEIGEVSHKKYLNDFLTGGASFTIPTRRPAMPGCAGRQLRYAALKKRLTKETSRPWNRLCSWI